MSAKASTRRPRRRVGRRPAPAAAPARGTRRFVILTGLSGAGKTQAIRALDDMPSAPDPDAESTEKLLHRISAIFSGEKSRETTIRQRLATEDQLSTLLTQVQGRELGEEFDPLLYELKESIREVTLHLQQLLRRCES